MKMVKMEQHTKALGATDEPAIAFSTNNLLRKGRIDGKQWPE
jgi:hypothetical protein